MRISPPNPAMQAADDSGVLHHGWSRWLLNLAASLGWSRGTPIYSELLMTIESGTYGTVDGNITRPEMADGIDASDQFAGKLPNDFRDGTDLIPFVEYAPADGNAGVVHLELGYSVAWAAETSPARAGQSVDETTEVVEQTVPGIALRPDRVDFTAITGTLFRKGDSVVARIRRQGAHANDTYGASIFILNAGFKYQREGIGWKTAHP